MCVRELCVCAHLVCVSVLFYSVNEPTELELSSHQNNWENEHFLDVCGFALGELNKKMGKNECRIAV